MQTVYNNVVLCSERNRKHTYCTFKFFNLDTNQKLDGRYRCVFQQDWFQTHVDLVLVCTKHTTYTVWNVPQTQISWKCVEYTYGAGLLFFLLFFFFYLTILNGLQQFLKKTAMILAPKVITCRCFLVSPKSLQSKCSSLRNISQKIFQGLCRYLSFHRVHFVQ